MKEEVSFTFDNLKDEVELWFEYVNQYKVDSLECVDMEHG